MTKIDKKKIKKILLVRNDKIGDMVLSTQVFRELRKAFPRAKITVIASDQNKSIIEKSKDVDEILILNFSPRKPKEFLKYLKLAKKIRREKFDFGVNLRGGFFGTFFLLWFGNVKYTSGFYNQYIGKFFLDVPLKKIKTQKHRTKLVLDLINKPLGLNATNNWPVIYTDKKDMAEFKRILKENKLKKYICIIPDASFEEKALPLKTLDSLIRKLKKEYPKKKIVLAGVDKEKINWLAKNNPGSVPLVRKPIRAVYLLFKNSDLVIAPDGGAIHLAWASKTRVVGILREDLPCYVDPLGKNVRFIRKEMKDVKVSELMVLIKELFKK